MSGRVDVNCVDRNAGECCGSRMRTDSCATFLHTGGTMFWMRQTLHGISEEMAEMQALPVRRKRCARELVSSHELENVSRACLWCTLKSFRTVELQARTRGECACPHPHACFHFKCVATTWAFCLRVLSRGCVFQASACAPKMFQGTFCQTPMGKMSDVDQEFAVHGVRVPVCVLLLEMKRSDFARSVAS